jgi:repressor LexA
MKKKDFGKRMAQLRKERQMTQDDLAAALRVSRSAIGMYEQGRREPDFEFLDTVADFFGVSIGFLVGGSDERGEYPRHDIWEENQIRRLTAYEMALILAYRKADGSTKQAAERVLGVKQ